MKDFQIVKIDGSKEPFNIDKLITSIGKSGVPLNKATNISEKIKFWAMKIGKGERIKSSMIRDKVIEIMSDDFPVEAECYRLYKK